MDTRFLLSVAVFLASILVYMSPMVRRQHNTLRRGAAAHLSFPSTRETRPNAGRQQDFTSIPVINISALVKAYKSHLEEGEEDGKAQMEAVSQMLHNACVRVGFFYVTGHGVPEKLQQRLVSLSRAFFALPEEHKQQIRMERAGRAWRGYFPPGGELTSGIPDRKEGIYFGKELSLKDARVLNNTPMHGPNLWPDQVGIEGYKETLLEYMDEVSQLAQIILKGIALGLGLSENYFADRFTQDPTVLFRVFNYERHRWGPSEDIYGVREHTDYGFLTVLMQDDSGGLQVRNRRGEWIEAPPVQNSFVVNLGDMLEIWTHGVYRATPHRVRNKGEADRLSFPLFFDPSWDSSLVPIQKELLQRVKERSESGLVMEQEHTGGVYERWDGADLLRMPEMSYGDFLWSKVKLCFPELAKVAAKDAMRTKGE